MKKREHLDDKINFIVRILFVMAFVETIVITILQNDTSNLINAFTALLGFSLTFVPEAVENLTKNKLRFSTGIKIAIVLFIFGAELLGEIESFYEKIPWWDIFLHGFSGIILGLVGFTLVYALNESASNRIHLSPLLVAAFAFFFALASGALWEIFEFAGDRIFNMNMQKFRPPAGADALYVGSWTYDAGLIDTMVDLIMDASCALGISVLGYIKIKTGKWLLDRKEKTK